MKGQASISQIQSFVIAFVVIGVAGSVGLSIMSGVQGSMTLTETVTGETDTATSPLPSNYTLDKSTESTFVEIESATVEWYDASAGSYTTLTEDTDFILYTDQGEVELQDSSTLTDFNDSEDEFRTNYTAEMQDTDARTGAGNAIEGMNELLGWLPIIGLVVAAAVVLGLVSGFGNSGKRMRA